MKNTLLKILLVALIAVSLSVNTAEAAGLTSGQIQAIMNLLSAFGAEQSVVNNVQVSLSGGTPTISGTSSQPAFCYDWTRNLRIGNEGSDVSKLRYVLGKDGLIAGRIGIGAIEGSAEFDEELASAIVEFQEKYTAEVLTPSGLRRGTGFVGPSTRAKLNQLYGCQTVKPVPAPVPISPVCAQVIAPAINSATGECREFSTPCSVPTGWKQVDSCKSSSDTSSQPYIGSITPSSGPVGTIVEIRGQNLNGFEGATYLSFLKENGESGSISAYSYLPAGATTLKFTIPDRMCTKNMGESGLPCPSYMTVTAGTYKIYATPWSEKSNEAQFTVTSSSSAQPSITVLSPNGGEMLKVGENYRIRWVSNNYNGSVRISLVSDTTYDNLVTIGANLGYYAWTPRTGLNGSSYKIRIASPDLTDDSDSYFTIAAATSTSGNFQPADTNQDGRISIDEVTKYGSLYGNNSTAQEASLIWKNGEKYIKIGNGFIPIHPADTDANGKISINEVTAYTAKYGNTTEAQNASAIWKQGEVYAFNSSGWVSFNPTSTVQPSIVTFQASPATIGSAQTSTLSWNTSNANRCVLQYGPSEESVSVNGTKIVSPSQTTSYRLWCVNDPGTGKDGPSVERTITVPVSSTATQPQITVLSPNGGESYVLGKDSITIRWSPATPGVSTIQLISSKGEKFQLYGQMVSGDPTNVNGYYVYQLPNNLSTIYPDTYYLNLIPANGSFAVQSNKFSILSPNATIPPSSGKYSISGITGQQTTYVSGAPITFSIKGIESDGTPASQQKGFNVQAHLYDATAGMNPSFQAVNGIYNTSSGYWDVRLVAPSDKNINYEVKVSLYCGYVGLDSSCAQKYGTNSQQVRTFQFKVTDSSSSQPSITVLSPNGGGNTSDQQIPYRVEIRSQKERGTLTLYVVSNPSSSNWQYGKYYFMASASGFSPSLSNNIYSGSSAIAGITAGNYYLMAVWSSNDNLENLTAFSSIPFTITAATSVQPSITSVAGKAAGSGEIDAGGSVGIQGTNLASYKDSTNVYIGGMVCTITQISNTLIYCTAPSSLTVGATYDLYVNTVGMGGDKVTSNIVRVKVLSNASQPSITSVFPTSGPADGSIVTLYGTGFKTGANVFFDNGNSGTIPALSVSSDGATLTFHIPTASMNIGTHTFKVANNDGTSYSNNISFTVTAPVTASQPSITVLSPNGGESLTRGNQITIRWTQAEAMPVSINASVGNGSYTIATMISGVMGQNSFVWTVGNSLGSYTIPDGQYQIMVNKYNATEINDKSDSYFTVTSSTATSYSGNNMTANLFDALKLINPGLYR